MRLIDADELLEHAYRDKLDSRELIANMINNAPTVKEIPTKIPIDVFEKLVSKEPNIRHCKDCKWWRDSDGVYRRGVHAESKCPINTKVVLDGEGYCYLFNKNE